MDPYESSRSVGGDERFDGPKRTSPADAAPKEIMTRLPRSRPKPSKTRQKTRARATPKRPPAKANASPRRQSPPRSLPESEPAPGFGRLAADGAVEAAKLPLKVGVEITSRALNAAARGLRRR